MREYVIVQVRQNNPLVLYLLKRKWVVKYMKKTTIDA